MKKLYKPLIEAGFSPEMIAIYLTILKLGRVTIKNIQEDIKEDFNLSYSQVYYSIKKLIEQKIIEQQMGFEKTYTAKNPEFFFERIRSEKMENIEILEERLIDQYKRSTLDFGQCTVRLNMYHFSSLDLGFRILSDRLFKNAEKTIIFIATPPYIFKRLKWELIDAYERGIEIKIYYSRNDFEELDDYYKQILPHINDCHIKIIENRYRTYGSISVNDEFTRTGHILVDGRTLVTYPFYRSSEKGGIVHYDIDFIEGFYNAPSIVISNKDILNQNEIIQMIDYIPAKEATLLDFLKTDTSIKKSELAKKLKLSGTDLKVLLLRLEKLGKIKVEKKIQEKGRPIEFIMKK